MKKALIIAATMIALTVAAQSNEIVFQKTYEVPGMNEKEIIQAFGTTQMEKEATTLNQISTALTFIGQPLSASSQPFKKKDVSQITCNIAATSWLPAVDGHYNAEVIVQAKDSRYRVTVSNMIDSKTGMKFSSIGSEGIKESCIKDIDKWLSAKHEQVKKLNANF